MLARWAVALQHDFAARMDWCVADEFGKANHPPRASLNDDSTQRQVELTVSSGQGVRLSSAGSSDVDGHGFVRSWFTYPEAGTCRAEVSLTSADGETTSFVAPVVERPVTLHVVLQLEDHGTPSLFAYRRAVITIRP